MSNKVQNNGYSHPILGARLTLGHAATDCADSVYKSQCLCVCVCLRLSSPGRRQQNTKGWEATFLIRAFGLSGMSNVW